jgi:hypothetical protein
MASMDVPWLLLLNSTTMTLFDVAGHLEVQKQTTGKEILVFQDAVEVCICSPFWARWVPCMYCDEATIMATFFCMNARFQCINKWRSIWWDDEMMMDDDVNLGDWIFWIVNSCVGLCKADRCCPMTALLIVCLVFVHRIFVIILGVNLHKIHPERLKY